MAAHAKRPRIPRWTVALPLALLLAAGGAEACLDRWLEGSGFEVGLLTGRGGAGKSRAAQRLCLSAVAHGWDAGYVWPADPNWSEAGVGPDRDLLAVVDYPEEHPRRIGLWIHQLKAAAEASGCRVRVLLLARSKEGWWFGPLVGAEDLDEPISVSDQGHHDPRETLADQYAAASSAYGTAAVPNAGTAASSLSTSLEAHVLALVGGSSEGLLARVLDREAAGWRAQWAQLPVLDRHAHTQGAQAAWRAVAVLTSVPCTTERQAIVALEAAGLAPEEASAATSWFDGLYGPGFAPLVPDPVADLLLLDLLDSEPVVVAQVLAHLGGRHRPRRLDARCTEPGRGVTPRRVIHPGPRPRAAVSSGPRDGAPSPPAGLTAVLAGRLVELCEQARRQALRDLSPLTPKLLADVLADTVAQLASVDADEARSAARAAAPTAGSSAPGMRRLEIALLEALVQALRSGPEAEDPETLAGLGSALHNLGTARADAGLDDLAYAATAEAVRIRRNLLDSPAARVSLGHSLHSMSIRHATGGELDAAVSVAHESTLIFEELAAADDSFEPQLARAYLNEATKASYAKDHETALDLAARAAAIRRGLVSDDRTTFELAITLLNLGGMRQRRDGVHSATGEAIEAIALLRPVRATVPGAEARLSTALANLAEALLDQGDAAAAIAPAAEAHSIREQLALFDPTARRSAAIALALLGRAQRYGDPLTARRQLSEALAELRSAGDTTVLRAQIEAAASALDEVGPAAAGPHAREA